MLKLKNSYIHLLAEYDYKDVYLRKNLDFVIDFIEKLRQGGVGIETTKQTEYFSSYFPRLNTIDHGWINWDDKVIQLEKFIFHEGAVMIRLFLSKKFVWISDQKFWYYLS